MGEPAHVDAVSGQLAHVAGSEFPDLRGDAVQGTRARGEIYSPAPISCDGGVTMQLG